MGQAEGASMLTIAEGNLLMNGTTAEWPPRDMNGAAIEIGARVFGTHDTFNGRKDHVFTVGGIRLQNESGELRWVVCSYEDDYPFYFEAYTEDCCVQEAAPC